MRDAEEFWDELLAQIEVGQVIPVIGPELLRVRVDGAAQPLYRVVAERLLAKYGVGADAVVLRPFHELHDAVSALTERGRRVQDLYRPINDLLKSTLDGGTAEPDLEPLRALAGIGGLRLFVSTTPDDMLARALDAERYGGAAKTDAIVFAPKLASGTPADLPELRTSAYSAVCYLFGRASPSPFVFAIHDEDTLEFMHSLQINAGDGMTRLFSELRQQHLLLVGCNFADWLSRLFIRLSNVQRLADNRGKHEFLVDASAAGDHALTLFLERFSPDTWVHPGGAQDFVAELARRWADRFPPAPAGEPAPADPPPAAAARTESTIFVSYSRTDLAAARALHVGLQSIGADVAWLDKSELKPGDDWDRRIRAAIGNCYLFLPLVSTHTEMRDEGFFREEWTLASERARRIQGRKFIIPVVVDRDYDGNAGRFELVPDSFPRAHFGHAPDGAMNADLHAELTRLIRERRLR